MTDTERLAWIEKTLRWWQGEAWARRLKQDAAHTMIDDLTMCLTWADRPAEVQP